MRRMKLLVVPLLLGAVTTAAQGAEDPRFGKARKSARVAGYTISKVQRWLHEVALKKIEPHAGLYHPDGNFNYQDAWADCYPFLVWAAWLTDLDALNGPVRGALHAEIKHCEKGFFTGSIEDARIYNQALNPQAIASLNPNEKSELHTSIICFFCKANLFLNQMSS